MRPLPTLALLALLPLGASGCLTFADDEGPILSIDLFWDEDPDDPDNFESGTCQTARVGRMEWALYDEDGERVVPRDSSKSFVSEPCADIIDVLEPRPGTYELELTAYDRDGDVRWAVTCTDLRVLRFDVAYECDIEGVE